MITLTFLDANGKKIIKAVDCDSLQDATIEGSNIAEENGWELVEVSEEDFI